MAVAGVAAGLALTGCTGNRAAAPAQLTPSIATADDASCPPPDPTVDGSGDPCRGIQDDSLLCHTDYTDAMTISAGPERDAALAEVDKHCSTGTYVP